MEKSMQQVQSEKDKMVPIDTSGESVEISLVPLLKLKSVEVPKSILLSINLDA